MGAVLKRPINCLSFVIGKTFPLSGPANTSNRGPRGLGGMGDLRRMTTMPTMIAASTINALAIRMRAVLSVDDETSAGVAVGGGVTVGAGVAAAVGGINLDRKVLFASIGLPPIFTRTVKV